MTNKPHMLDQLRIAAPCDADWGAMTGDDRKRYCGLCKLDVYDLSAMSRDEAEALVSGAEGLLCARFARRVDGTVVTRDCGPVRRRIARRVRRLRAAAGALFGLLSTVLLTACGRGAPEQAARPAPAEAPSAESPPKGPAEEVIEIMRDVKHDPMHEMGRMILPYPPTKKAAPDGAASKDD